MASQKKEHIRSIISQIQKFRFCGPSDDPDEITAVTSGFRYLTVQFKRLVRPLVEDDLASRIDGIEVEFDNLYSAYDAKAEIDALWLDVEPILEFLDDGRPEEVLVGYLVNPSIIDKLKHVKSKAHDPMLLAQMCKEINSSFSHGNLIAATLLMRAVLNYVPPIFGHKTFTQVTANIGRSLKDSFSHLENGLRKIADFHTHRTIGIGDMYPSSAQVEPFKPQFELLLHQVITIMENG
jgi:hypothetical protein